MSERVPKWWQGTIPSQALELTSAEEARLRNVDREFPEIVELIPLDHLDPLLARKDVDQIRDQALRSNTPPTPKAATLDDATDSDSVDPDAPPEVDEE